MFAVFEQLPSARWTDSMFILYSISQTCIHYYLSLSHCIAFALRDIGMPFWFFLSHSFSHQTYLYLLVQPEIPLNRKLRYLELGSTTTP
jgi:hypothetical protein